MNTTGETQFERHAAPGEAPAVLLALDGSEGSLAAVPVARTLSRLLGATLHLVHAAERLLPPRELARRLGIEADDAWGAVVDEMSGPPAEGILQVAAQSRTPWIVLATSSTERHRRTLGSTALGVLARATCPVVLVRPERGVAPWEPGRVLLPHDGSPVTAVAFNQVVPLARRAGSSLYVLHVASLARQPPAGTVPVPTYVDQPQHEWPEWSREFLERMEVFLSLPPEMHPRLFLSRGDAAGEIVRFAGEHEADLVAVAWHGHFDEGHGAVVRDVVLDAPCPVVFLRVEEREEAVRGIQPMRSQAGSYAGEPRQ